MVKLREGDQPLPKESNAPPCHQSVVDDLRRRYSYNKFKAPIVELIAFDVEKRLQLGIERYKLPLTPHNGRDFLRDQYEEILDALAYGWGCLYEEYDDKARDQSELYYLMNGHYLKLEEYAIFLRETMRDKQNGKV